MSKKKIEISKFITPGDFFAVIVVLIGIITAIIFEEIAIRMIGVSIAILGAVALFMLISQRLSEIVEPRYSKTNENQPEFKMTTTKDSSAKRQTVEDFENSFGSDDDYPIQINPIQKNDVIESIDNKIIVSVNKENSEINQNTSNFNDGFSGMRIVGKIKPKNIEVISKDSEKAQNYSKSSDIKEKISYTQTVSENISTTETQKQTLNNKENLFENISKEIIEKQDIKPIEKIEEESEKIAVNKISEPISDDNSQKFTYSGKIIDLPLNMLTETDILLGDEPRKEFEYFLTRVLTIIRSSTDTRTALFFLFNSRDQELILESYVTTIPQSLKSQLKFKLSNDIISQIISNSKPQILSEINPAAELDLIPYYSTTSNTCSLIGVPVFWGEGVIGVIVADSTSSNAYDSSTVAFLGHFTKLVGAIVKSYTHKFDLLQASKALESINMFYSFSQSIPTENDNISDRITNTLKTLFPNANIGLCGYNSETDSWQIKSFRGYSNDLTGLEINIEDSVIGDTIYQCKTFSLQPYDKTNHIRVYPQEKDLQGQFVSVPIKSKTQIYGAIFVELIVDESFSEFDISIIELIGDHAGNSIERIYLSETLQSSALVDYNTGLLNPIAFYNRINEELLRSSDFKTNLTLCLFKFDKYSSLDPSKFPDRFDYAVQLIIQRIRKFLKSYDIYGNVSNDMYGILFIGKNSNESKLIAERIRTDVANTIIEHSGGKFSITISMGCCSPTKDFDIDLLIKDTIIGLNQAYENGNQVQVLY